MVRAMQKVCCFRALGYSFLPGCMVSVGCTGLPLPFAPGVSYTLSCQAHWWDLFHLVPLVTHKSSFCFIPCMSEVTALISLFLLHF